MSEVVLRVTVAGRTTDLDPASVLEVLARPQVTRLPHAPKGVLGLLPWRDRVLCLTADLGPALEPFAAAVVLQRSPEPVAVAVDAVEGLVLSASESGVPSHP